MENLKKIVSELPDYIYDLMLDGQRAGYFDVFNEINEEELAFEYQRGEEYFIDDSYYMGSKDYSEEIGLTFVNFGEGGKNPFTELGVELNITSLEYKIIEEKCGEDKVRGVMNHILCEMPDLINALKRRYSEMKEVGRELRRQRG